MPTTQNMIPEFDHEVAVTRRLLERVPEDRKDWKPHEKSMSLGQLAIHLAQIPSYGSTVLESDERNFNPPGGQPYRPPVFESTSKALDFFDQNARRTREAMERAPDESMMQTWTLKNGEATVFSMPRIAALKTLMLKHMVHHRGQLSVYLRLLDVPVPSIYGPSADTPV